MEEVQLRHIEADRLCRVSQYKVRNWSKYSKSIDNQKVELLVKALTINQMTIIGMPSGFDRFEIIFFHIYVFAFY